MNDLTQVLQTERESELRPFDTSLLDHAVAERKAAWERERRLLLDRLWQWLAAHGRQYNLERLYIFGSLVKSNRFTDHSDIDVAISDTAADHLIPLMAALSRDLERDVDIVILSQCHFADKIQKEGVVWTALN